MEIQKITSTDLEAVMVLVKEVSEVDVLPLFSLQGQKEYKERVLPDLTMAFDEEIFLSIKAVSDGKLLGFAALRDGNYLTHLFVSKSSQGLGVGRQLLHFLLNATEAKDVSLRSSVNAVGFYERHNFVVTGEETDFNGIRFVPMTLVQSE